MYVAIKLMFMTFVQAYHFTVYGSSVDELSETEVISDDKTD